jgi:CDP-glycerol glycerophosphotransferase (TagB/SpsB family)
MNSRNIPRGVPLAYFPLHFQPERTTDPESGYFSQQVLAIKLLLKILPKEWHVVVKEHPRQNRHEYPNLRRLNYRDPLEYQEIFKLSRVIPVSMFMPSSELLASCQLSASCTGSVLWESMLQGKPSISFGPVWHSDCKSSPSIHNIVENPSILTALLSKDKGGVLKDVDDFIKSNSNNFINASNSEQFARQSNQDVNLLISNLSEAIDYILKVES